MMRCGLFLILLITGLCHAQRSQFEKAANLRVITTTYYKIYFTGALNQQLDNLAFEADRFIADIETRWLIKLPEDKIKVYLINQPAKGSSHCDGPDWLTTHYDPNRKHIYLGIRKNTTYQEPPVLEELKHMSIHYLVNMEGAKRLPVFMEEGLAQHYGNRLKDSDHFLTIWAFQPSVGVVNFMQEDTNYKGRNMYYGALLSRQFIKWLWQAEPNSEIPFIQALLQDVPEEELWSIFSDVDPEKFPQLLAAFDREVAPAFSLTDVLFLGDTWRIIFGILITAWLWLRMIPIWRRSHGRFTSVEAVTSQEALITAETFSKAGPARAGARSLQPKALPDEMALPPSIDSLPDQMDEDFSGLPDAPSDLPDTPPTPILTDLEEAPPITETNNFDFLDFNEALPMGEEIQDLEETPPEETEETKPPTERVDGVEFYEAFDDEPARPQRTHRVQTHEPEPVFEIDDSTQADEPTFEIDDTSSQTMATQPVVAMDESLEFIDSPLPEETAKPKIQRGKDLKVGIAGKTKSGEAVLDIDLSLDLDQSLPGIGMDTVPITDLKTVPVAAVASFLEEQVLDLTSPTPSQGPKPPKKQSPQSPMESDEQILDLDDTHDPIPPQQAIVNQSPPPQKEEVMVVDEGIDESEPPKKKAIDAIDEDVDSVFGNWGVD